MVVITMENGKQIKLQLEPDKAPSTVKNFEKLVSEKFYDGLTFHRIIPGFMIQGGCPDGTGMGGPGYSIKGEFAANGVKNPIKHKRGVISMARAMNPNSAGSQFFIMHQDAPHLDGDYAAFIRRHTGKADTPGNFVDEFGRILGRHRGIAHYTIGQRKGLGIPSNQPLYVKAIDPKSNQVVLSENDALFSQQLTGENFNWIAWEAPPRQFRCSAKIRYRQTEQPCEVTVEEDGSVQVLFDRPQRAITPGQAVVLYDGDTVLGGGTIL